MIPEKSPIPTQMSIAKALGVSRVTVSHVLSGREAHRYNEETRRRILTAAQEMGYRPNRAAQVMRKGRSNLIGIIHFGTAYHIARQAAHYLPQAINQLGFETFVVDLSWHGECHKRVLEHLIDARVEGVIISHMVESFDRKEVEILTQAGIPAVTFAGKETLGIPALYADTASAFRDLVIHLAQLGHRELLLLTNDYQSRTTQSRIAGFQEGLQRTAQFGVTGSLQQLPADRTNFDVSASAYEHVRKLIQRNALPDAILCTNDQWARGVFAAALEAGLEIPRDLAVTGFDNEPFGSRAPYHLTTATPNVGEECEQAVAILAKMMAGLPLPKQVFVCPCELLIRRSCGANGELSPPATTTPQATHIT